MASFKISREFFAKAKADYADWRWAWVREICQNSMDCGSSRIDVMIQRQGANTQITVSNDGSPMTEDILINKFLTLGGSAKESGVGGFGKAKEVLICCHLSWSIRTGILFAEGAGGDYQLTIGLDPQHGTTTTVLMEGDEVDRLIAMFQRFASLAQWKGILTVNGQVFATDLRKGSPRREYEWGKVYTNQQHSNLLVVRIGGQPMFTRNIRFKGCVLVELTGTSGQRLVASRDRLQYRYADELDELLNELAVDTRSALRQQRAEYKRFLGEKVKAEGKRPQAQPGLDVAALVQTLVQPEPGSQPAGSVRSVAVSRENRSVSIGPEFICKQCAGMETPAYYLPGDQFSSYAKGLVKAWVLTLKKLYELHDLEGSFSVGFIFDEDVRAECEESSAYGLVYYLSPAAIVKNQKFGSRSFKARFSSAWTNRFEIMSLAAHEFVHGAFGIGQHNEDFAAKLTEVVGVMMAHVREFSPFYR
jgi:Histidine kinase-, DNA gyrase B-, and HSP90-like ATPase